MSSSKNQSSIMIGIGLMVIAIVIIIYSLNLPKVADISESTTAQTSLPQFCKQLFLLLTLLQTIRKF